MRVKDQAKKGLSSHLSGSQNRKSHSSSFLGLSLLLNHTETLSLQAERSVVVLYAQAK